MQRSYFNNHLIIKALSTAGQSFAGVCARTRANTIEHARTHSLSRTQGHFHPALIARTSAHIHYVIECIHLAVCTMPKPKHMRTHTHTHTRLCATRSVGRRQRRRSFVVAAETEARYLLPIYERRGCARSLHAIQAARWVAYAPPHARI